MAVNRAPVSLSEPNDRRLPIAGPLSILSARLLSIGTSGRSTKTLSPSRWLMSERRAFHKTILQEFYQVTFRKKIYETIEQLQNELDQWIDHYNKERTHQGKICKGRTPMQTLEKGKAIWRENFVA